MMNVYVFCVFEFWEIDCWDVIIYLRLFYGYKFLYFIKFIENI